MHRLKDMTRDEVSWRVRAASRIAVDRLGVRFRPPQWRRDHISRILAADVMDPPLRDAIAARAWDAVHDSLAQRLRQRRSRFVIDPGEAAELRDRILHQWADATRDATARGNEILAGRYHLLGYRNLTFTGPDGHVDWHADPVHRRRAPIRFWADIPYLDPQVGDHKIIWELNRHQHWLQLGRALWLTHDVRYANRIIEELDQWLAANPPLVGINWASMLELGFRTMSWTWALYFLLHSPVSSSRSGWLVDLFVALDRQLIHIERNLSTYFSPNTHLTGEALALYVAGVALPELTASRRWRATGRRILIAEIDRQILPDGGHAERSTHYHRYTLDFYLMALAMARRDGDSDAEERFRTASLLLADYARCMADGEGRLPLIGDDDGGTLWRFGGRDCHDIRDSLAVAAVLLDRPDLAPWGVEEEAYWVLGAGVRGCGGAEVHGGAEVGYPSRLLSDSGYVVARNDRGDHVVFDVGDHGYMNGGHAHADALSLTMTLAGHPFLIDPGTATYTMDAEVRDRFRSSASHNTLTIDHGSQAQPRGPFHWQTRADARLHRSYRHPHVDWAEASHDAYGPILHRRSLLRTATAGWLIVDQILGTGEHAASAHWHFDPDWTLSSDQPGRLHACHSNGDEAWILYDSGEAFLAHGDDESGLGWCAPKYGAIVPAWTARITRIGDVPFDFLTWIGTGSDTSGSAPSLQRLRAGSNSDVVAARLHTGPRSVVFLLRPGHVGHNEPELNEVAGYHTDARVFHCVEERGGVSRLHLIDAAHAMTPGSGGISVSASERMPDLHIVVENGVLDIQSSEPPSSLRIQSPALRHVSVIRLNHRHMPRPTTGIPDAIVIHAAEWSARIGDLLTSTA